MAPQPSPLWLVFTSQLFTATGVDRTIFQAVPSIPHGGPEAEAALVRKHDSPPAYAASLQDHNTDSLSRTAHSFPSYCQSDNRLSPPRLLLEVLSCTLLGRVPVLFGTAGQESVCAQTLKILNKPQFTFQQTQFPLSSRSPGGEETGFLGSLTHTKTRSSDEPTFRRIEPGSGHCATGCTSSPSQLIASGHVRELLSSWCSSVG